MIPVFSRDQARGFDRRTIEQGHVPGLVLMENAGRGVVDAVERHWPDRPLRDAHVVLVCGAGNNGGDGFVVARHLRARGSTVDVFLTQSSAKLAGDARTQFEAMAGTGIVARGVTDDLLELRSALATATFVVDAVFGTGLSRDVEGHDAAVFSAVEDAKKPVVAVDVPSGLDANTGAMLGRALAAELTVTFVTLKLGLLTPAGARLAGKVVVADIGVAGPRSSHEDRAADLLERADVARLFSPRASGIYKNGAGHVLIFAGSPGHVGAAVMAAHGAFRAGAGLVTVATWPKVADCLDARTVEVMTVRLDANNVEKSVDDALAKAKVVVMGPGFGTDEASRAVVRHVLGAWQGPSVVDASAIAMFPGEAEVFAKTKGAAVLTPHPGELGVLLGTSSKDVERDRFAALSSAVDRTRSVTVLKGAHTLIGAPDEHPVINASGTSALATAGSGDVLSGTIGALACVLDPFEAAFAGVHLHGLAAEAWSRGHGDRGLLAHEIADQYPGLIAGLLRDSETRA